MEFDEIEAQSEPSTEQPGKYGRFYLQELINSGGMSDIWIATDQDKKTFALRRLHRKLKFNFTARRRFVRGCEILSKIHNHEFVVNYIEHGKIDGLLYLLMDYVESSNLKQLLFRSDPLLTENVAQILIDMTLSLEHVHDSGFMHLDFKPENILITRNGGLRLVDFDLAQPKPDSPKKMSDNPGTPAYMAPEQLQRKEIDERADIFALGVTAYEILPNSKPFPGDTPDEILRKQLNDEMIAPHDLNPEIPPALEKIVVKCLQRDPANRYPNMSVVSRDFQNALYV